MKLGLINKPALHEVLDMEYDTVKAYQEDMQEIDALLAPLWRALLDRAIKLRKERDSYEEGPGLASKKALEAAMREKGVSLEQLMEVLKEE